ncbi:MAG: hypothetical protein ACREBJ_07770 [Nitrosotalea sp.]
MTANEALDTSELNEFKQAHNNLQQYTQISDLQKENLQLKLNAIILVLQHKYNLTDKDSINPADGTIIRG